MRKYLPIIKSRDVSVVLAILALFMVIGSIWDYPISQALHDQANPFGIFFTAFGELPMMAGLIFSGLLLLLGSHRRVAVSSDSTASTKPAGGIPVNSTHTVGRTSPVNRAAPAAHLAQIIAGALLFLAGSAVLLILPGHYLPFPPAITVCLGLGLIALISFLTVRLCRHADPTAMLKVAAAVVSVILLELLLVTLIKIPWERPRMRLIAINSEAFFQPWWVIGGNLKETLAAAGIKSEEFKSFPSAHTSSAAVMILLSLLPLLTASLRQKGRLLFFLGCLWGVLVALSRIIMGAHFVTDTVIGFCLTLLITLLMVRLIFKNEYRPT